MTENQSSLAKPFSLTITQEGDILMAKFHHNSKETAFVSQPLYGPSHNIDVWCFASCIGDLFLQTCFPEAKCTGSFELHLPPQDPV